MADYVDGRYVEVDGPKEISLAWVESSLVPIFFSGAEINGKGSWRKKTRKNVSQLKSMSENFLINNFRYFFPCLQLSVPALSGSYSASLGFIWWR